MEWELVERGDGPPPLEWLESQYGGPPLIQEGQWTLLDLRFSSPLAANIAGQLVTLLRNNGFADRFEVDQTDSALQIRAQVQVPVVWGVVILAVGILGFLVWQQISSWAFFRAVAKQVGEIAGGVQTMLAESGAALVALVLGITGMVLLSGWRPTGGKKK